MTSQDEILIARFRERRGTDKTHFQKILPGSENFRNQPECPALTAILGISAFYHDSAAALVVDGQLIAAAQEERFTRKKHDEGFPQKAVDYCLAQANITPEQIDYVAFYDKPLRKFERLLETYLAYAPAGYRSFRKAMPVWLQQKLYMPREIRTTAMGVGRGNQIELTHEIRFPHSLGLLYSAFTYYTGFKVNSGEYKLMGLAPYGEPKFRDLILNNLLVLKEDGSFQMDMSYFNYCQGLTMTSEKLHRLFGAPPRKPESLLTQREMDLAASIQSVTEEVMLRMARHVRKTSGSKNLVLAGGVALNCVGKGKILREGVFDNVWIQPASGDAGGALGAAMFVWHQLLEKPRKTQQPDAQR